MQYEYIVSSLQDTEKIGLLLGKWGQPGDVILLEGDLGAGKTTLTQSIARGIEVSKDEYVSSPSFAILHEYKGRIPLYHMDLYRLGGEDEVVDLGFDELFYGEGLCVIEWPARAGELLPENALKVEITHGENDTRRFLFSSTSSHPLIERLMANL